MDFKGGIEEKIVVKKKKQMLAKMIWLILAGRCFSCRHENWLSVYISASFVSLYCLYQIKPLWNRIK